MRALKFITGHMIYNPAYTYKFQLKTTHKSFKFSILFDLVFQEGECVAKLLTIEADDLYRNLLKPKIKVGNEFVIQGRNKDQVYFSIGGLCKAIYDKLFKWLVYKCNTTLSTKTRKAFFIGVLDIAGFEIFEVRCLLNENWYFVTKIVLTYCEKKLFQ